VSSWSESLSLSMRAYLCAGGGLGVDGAPPAAPPAEDDDDAAAAPTRAAALLSLSRFSLIHVLNRPWILSAAVVVLIKAPDPMCEATAAFAGDLGDVDASGGADMPGT